MWHSIVWPRFLGIAPCLWPASSLGNAKRGIAVALWVSPHGWPAVPGCSPRLHSSWRSSCSTRQLRWTSEAVPQCKALCRRGRPRRQQAGEGRRRPPLGSMEPEGENQASRWLGLSGRPPARTRPHSTPSRRSSSRSRGLLPGTVRCPTRIPTQSPPPPPPQHRQRRAGRSHSPSRRSRSPGMIRVRSRTSVIWRRETCSWTCPSRPRRVRGHCPVPF